MSTHELLEKEATSWARLEAAVANVADGRRDEPGVVPGWSVKDLSWHCGYWAGYVAEVLERQIAGEPPEPERDDAYWDARNDDVTQEARVLDWDQIWERSATNRASARAALTALGDAISDDSLEDFTGETFEHYDEHAAEIEAFAAR